MKHVGGFTFFITGQVLVLTLFEQGLIVRYFPRCEMIYVYKYKKYIDF